MKDFKESPQLVPEILSSMWHHNRTRVICCSWSVLLLCLMTRATPTLAQSSRSRIPLAISTTPGTDRLLESIITDLRAGKFEQAAAGISRFEKEHPNAFVPVANGRVLSGWLIINLLVGQLPEASRLQFSHSDALRALAHRRRHFALAELKELLDHSDELWRFGEVASARDIWNLLAVSPDQDAVPSLWQFPLAPESLQAAAISRLALADLLEGKLRSSHRRATILANRFPDVRNHLAGRDEEDAIVLQELLKEAENWPTEAFLIPAHQNRTSSSWRPCQPVRIDFSSWEWSVPVENDRQTAWSALRSERTNPDDLSLTTWKNIVLIQDASGLRALSLTDGQSAWPYGDDDPGILIENGPVETADGPDPVGTAVRGGIVVDQNWYGRLGPAWISMGSASRLPSASRVVCLDLSAEGLLRWARSASEFATEPDSGLWMISGEPVFDDGHLLIPMRGAGPGEPLRMVCLDAESGITVWDSSLDSLLEGAGDLPVRGGDCLAVRNGTVYWNVDGEFLMSVDRFTGTRQWLTTLPESNHGQSDEIVNDVLVESGQVFALSPGSVTALDPATGAVRWMSDLGANVKDLLGQCDDVLIVAGNGLWGIDRFSGEVRWTIEAASARYQGGGRGLLLGRSVLWPTREELWTVDAASGQLLQRDFLRALVGVGGGNLLLTENSLLIAERQRVTAFRVLISPLRP